MLSGGVTEVSAFGIKKGLEIGGYHEALDQEKQTSKSGAASARHANMEFRFGPEVMIQTCFCQIDVHKIWIRMGVYLQLCCHQIYVCGYL